jgi:hypothetical protein
LAFLAYLSPFLSYVHVIGSAAEEVHLAEKIFLIKSQNPIGGLLTLFHYMQPFPSYFLIFYRFHI